VCYGAVNYETAWVLGSARRRIREFYDRGFIVDFSPGEAQRGQRAKGSLSRIYNTKGGAVADGTEAEREIAMKRRRWLNIIQF
jgi:hypothetical protein